MIFLSPVVKKWQLVGDDGNEFDRSTEGRAEAWREAQAAADLGMPWAGATFRLIDVVAGNHADDCAIGLDATAWCDCGVEPEIVEERVLFPSAPGGVVETEGEDGGFAAIAALAARQMSETIRKDREGPPERLCRFEREPVLAYPAEASEPFGEVESDGKAALELSRLSPAKVAEPWTGRPAQMQILSNTLYGRKILPGKRADIKQRMEGQPLSALPRVVAEVLGEE